jgi:hypothetical protein
MSAKRLDNVGPTATHIAMRTSVAIALTILAGCASDAASEDGLEFEQQDLTAKTSFYRVPVSDPALKKQASFPITAKVQRFAGQIRVHYDMPVGLVGAPNVAVDLVGPDTGLVLKLAGDAGLGTCTATADGTIICNERLPGLTVNLEGVRKQAVLEGLSAADVDARVEIAKRFITDPIGIMRAQFSPAVGGGGNGGNGGGRQNGRDR